MSSEQPFGFSGLSSSHRDLITNSVLLMVIISKSKVSEERYSVTILSFNSQFPLSKKNHHNFLQQYMNNHNSDLF